MAAEEEEDGGASSPAAAALCLAALSWLLLQCCLSLRDLARTTASRWERWELLEQEQREIDLAPLGLKRRFVVRQEFSGRCAPSEEGLGTGGALWAGALELSSFLLHEASDTGVTLGGKRVIELGAGLGLASMVAAVAPASCRPSELVLTDGHAPVVVRCPACPASCPLTGRPWSPWR